MILRKSIFFVAVVVLLALLTGCCYPFDNPCDISNPSIDVEKYVAYGCPTTGTRTDWDDADNPPGPTVPLSKHVYYQIVITNTGDVELTNVEVSDNELFGSMYIGNLLPGETLTIEPDPIKPIQGQNINIATVIGYYSCMAVQDSDAACYNTP